LRTPLGYAGAYLSNAISRRWLGAWIDRVVFSSRPEWGLPFECADLPSHQAPLNERNFLLAMQASCAIPFLLQAVQHIPDAPPGAYWDGGITDYHLHLNYQTALGLVLYPHFQPHVVPGWLDKALKWRHPSTDFLSRMVLLCPTPEWVARLPQGKLPDRTDFLTHARDVGQRIQVWQTAVAQAQQLADEWQAWLHQPDLNRIEPLP
jgi:hypothetical protein